MDIVTCCLVCYRAIIGKFSVLSSILSLYLQIDRTIDNANLARSNQLEVFRRTIRNLERIYEFIDTIHLILTRFNCH